MRLGWGLPNSIFANLKRVMGHLGLRLVDQNGTVDVIPAPRAKTVHSGSERMAMELGAAAS